MATGRALSDAREWIIVGITDEEILELGGYHSRNCLLIPIPNTEREELIVSGSHGNLAGELAEIGVKIQRGLQ